MTFGESATKSAACFRMRSTSLAPQRMSTRALRPTAQPASCRPCRNAARRACPSASSAVRFISTPMRRMRSPCCARAASGHAATEPANTLMKSRRLMQPPPGLTTTLIYRKMQPSRHARVHRAERRSSLLTDRACSNRFFNLLLNSGHIETGTALHRWEIDERLRCLRYLLLDEHEAPELVGEPVVIGD